MHKGVEWVQPTTKLAEIAKLMQKHDIGAIPVGENDKLIGMVTDRDIVCRAVANGGDMAKLTARDVMTKGIVYCHDTQDLAEAIRVMQEKQLRRLPVISEARRMVGMLSLGDVSHAGSRDVAGGVAHAVSAHHH